MRRKTLLSSAVHVEETVAHRAHAATERFTEGSRAVDPGLVEQEPGAGGEAHAVEAGVQVERRACGQEGGDRSVFRPRSGVFRGPGKSELHVVARQLPHHVTHVAVEVVGAVLPAEVIDRRQGLLAPGRVARLAVRIDVGDDVPGGLREQRIAFGTRGEVGGEPAQHRGPDRLVRVAPADQADVERTAAEEVAHDLSPFAGPAEHAGRRKGRRGGEDLLDGQG